MSSIHLTELLSPATLNPPIPIFYNRSDYYYNLDMVKKANIHPLDYYYCASGYVGFLVNFLSCNFTNSIKASIKLFLSFLSL